MKLSFAGVSVICLLGVSVMAQEATQKVVRTLPTRLNPATPPPAPPISVKPITRPVVQPTTQKVVQPLGGPAPAAQTPAAINSMLTWDSEVKECSVKPGEMEAHFTFFFTNVSSETVVINSATGSCGCTVPKLPQVPWTNAPGAVGEIPVTMNLAGKSGIVFKTVNVNTDKGLKMLTVKSIIPPPEPPGPLTQMDRNRNQEMAKVDRQAVFKGDCAKCHVEPTKGLLGKQLYEKACGICHEAEHRATMVADLHNLNHDTNADFWKTWISMGKPGSLMPGFSASQGGPLNEAQIDSLVEYLVSAIPARAVKTAATK
jgi:hypothetical protein